MNRQRPIDERLSEWFLHEEPGEIPDRVLDATFARTRAVRQDAAVVGWRVRDMFPRITAAAAVAAVIVIACVNALGVGLPGPSVGPGGAPSPIVSPTQSPDTSPSASLPLGSKVVQTRAGTITYKRPPGWMSDVANTQELVFEANDGTVVIGVLSAAVDPDSERVTAPVLDPDVGTSVDEFIAWLETHPRVDTTEPIAMTVGGHPAKQLDVTLKEGQHYPQGSIPSRLGLAFFAPPAPAVGPSNGETHRFTLVEFGDRTLVIDAWALDIDAFAPKVSQLLNALSLDAAE